MNVSKRRSKRLNQLSMPAAVVVHFFLIAFALCCIIPFVFTIIISFTTKESLSLYGFSFFPHSTNLEAYKAAIAQGEQMWLSYLNSFIVTIVGTILSVFICVLYSYGMFRKDYPARKFFTFFAFFTMMFGGGLAPTVMVCRMLGMGDNYAALIIPLLVSPFNFIVMRTFFATSIPVSLIESAGLDGSGEFRTLFRIVAPIAKPGIATIALLNALAYWNDWLMALLYINNQDLFPLQYFLYRLQNSIEFLRRNTQYVTNIDFANLPTDSLKMALCVFIVVPIACAYPFFQRYIVAGLTIGAVKE